MGKRANGEGTIYRRKDGRWCATITREHGPRKHFLGQTREQVSHKLTAALKARDDGLPAIVERQTVAQFLKGWLEAVVAWGGR